MVVYHHGCKLDLMMRYIKAIKTASWDFRRILHKTPPRIVISHHLVPPGNLHLSTHQDSKRRTYSKGCPNQQIQIEDQNSRFKRSSIFVRIDILQSEGKN